MADLDDFFAKKDRKKSKGKKFMTTEEIAKKLEETGKKPEKTKKDKPIIQTSMGLQEGDDFSEDEWKNFEEEKKDYTGLKIQNLTIEDSSDSENNDGEPDRGMEEYGSGEMSSKKKGPWKVIGVENTAKENSTGSAGSGAGGGGGGGGAGSGSGTGTGTGGGSGAAGSGSGGGGGGGTASGNASYVPPHMRNQNQANRERSSRVKSGAPDINNEEYFPTLSAAKSETGSWNKSNRRQEGAFEEVRNSKSHSNRHDPSHRQQSLQIGNKFGALETDHS